jgi:type II secretory pathway pseudopilin PulG
MTSPRQHRAFVLLTALLVLALVGVAIAALATATSYDGHRTIRQWQSAQLEQMLLAGAVEAGEHLKTGPSSKAGQSWNVNLPGDFAAQGGALETSVISSENSELKLLINARFGDRSERQILLLRRDASGWKLVSAELS